MMRALTVAAAVVVVVAAAGCSADEPGPGAAAEPTGSPSADPFAPVSGQAQIRMLYTGVPGTSRHPSAAAYDAAVELGAPVGDGAGCGLSAPAGTVTVPLTLTLTHTADPDRPVQAAGPSPSPSASISDGAGVSSDPLPAEPVVSVEAVGGAGPLRWQDPRGGDCTDEPDLSATGSWEFRQQVQVSGFLTGVPAADPAGAGVRVGFVRELWEIHEGTPEPLTVTY
ncbi:hypothetical protein ACOQFV_24625 [Nocardiopsis changdeensis]|uniref:Uncharacterized protein n=1 Tax=Nocardiopsis changdeensis TaxID=2831969 RepID=A0A975QC95_9ACTN|nr:MULTISPECIES: hypothetical protein [Nocardiopsis]QUX26424.1 hypothetical protein KGD84_32515 [Nocardiopsis changdeensis]QYX40696.1 hypothetical protein K1J57_32365 [Nocardiopsis sp. MT53]